MLHLSALAREQISNSSIGPTLDPGSPREGETMIVLTQTVKAVWLEDKSTNGTFINGKKLGKNNKAKLRTGHEVKSFCRLT